MTNDEKLEALLIEIKHLLESRYNDGECDAVALSTFESRVEDIISSDNEDEDF